MQLAQDLGVEVIKCERGRATQMNAGAKNATGNGLIARDPHDLQLSSLYTALQLLFMVHGGNIIYSSALPSNASIGIKTTRARPLAA